jgi:hypothetical protein
MTLVVNLFGGPGAGKSTLAAKLFADLKDRGVSVELVTEYVKTWAWEGRPISNLDPLWLVANQFQTESRLYGKVDVIITDSPLLLGAFYDEKESCSDILCRLVTEFKDRADVIDINLFVNRPKNKMYDKAGRYESESAARQLDLKIRQYLSELGILPHRVSNYDSALQFVIRSANEYEVNLRNRT